MSIKIEGSGDILVNEVSILQTLTFDSLLSTNGYQKLPGGLIIQWGYNPSNSTVTFPVAFPTAAFFVGATMSFNSNKYENQFVTSLTSVNFYLGLSGINNAAYWIAIGC